jgi:hypothetical protein
MSNLYRELIIYTDLNYLRVGPELCHISATLSDPCSFSTSKIFAVCLQALHFANTTNNLDLG